MQREELLRRIDEALAAAGLTDRAASLLATGRPDFIRDLRRHPASKVDASKLAALARAVGVAPAYFVDEAISDMVARAYDPARWARATQIAARLVHNHPSANPTAGNERLVELVYEALGELADDDSRDDGKFFAALLQWLFRWRAEARGNQTHTNHRGTSTHASTPPRNRRRAGVNRDRGTGR